MPAALPQGGAALVAEEMLKDVRESGRRSGASPSSPQKNFAEVLDTKLSQVGSLESTQSTNKISGLNNGEMMGRLRSAAESAENHPLEIPAIGQSLDQNPAMSGVKRIMEDVLQGQNKLDEIMGLAMSGRNFTTPELIAMQAGVYRFTQEMELLSKVIEKGTSAVKQTMNTQV